ncbi:hypothetical protein PR001_g18567 [Phytophthora rubi]|uniref:RxLR effector protein n=1 Tax=Phytophthora rubi TaxID=129364 RepID=A0A6A3K197_9STRA|nr:hypothetical protein PR001_g18567 [Phytophthora rubi]
MHLAHLLLLLVLLLANANPVTSIEDQSAISQTTSQRSLRDEVDAKRVVLSSPKDDDPSGVANAESEERGFLSTAASKLKSVVGKNPGLSSKLGSTRQNSEMAAAVGKMPIVKQLEATVQKDPGFFQEAVEKTGAVQEVVEGPSSCPSICDDGEERPQDHQGQCQSASVRCRQRPRQAWCSGGYQGYIEEGAGHPWRSHLGAAGIGLSIFLVSSTPGNKG